MRDPKSGLVGEVLSVSRDITERRRLEEELRQAQKMDAVGQLAGGVAHDFNNLLTTIRGFADLLARSFEGDDTRRKDVAEILKATERAASLTRQLLAFSKRQVLRVEALSVNAHRRRHGEDHSPAARRRRSRSRRPSIRRSGPCAPIPGQLEQVLLNLALNARDAMPKGGTLRIATRNVDVAPVNAPDTVVPRGQVRRARDAGHRHGHDRRDARASVRAVLHHEESERALGPRPGDGVRHRRAERGPHLRREQPRDAARRSASIFPRRPNGSAAANAARAPRRIRRPATSILIAEDNEGVRALTVRILVGAGYHVLEGCDGVDALETLRDRCPSRWICSSAT